MGRAGPGAPLLLTRPEAGGAGRGRPRPRRTRAPVPAPTWVSPAPPPLPRPAPGVGPAAPAARGRAWKGRAGPEWTEAPPARLGLVVLVPALVQVLRGGGAGTGPRGRALSVPSLGRPGGAGGVLGRLGALGALGASA